MVYDKKKKKKKKIRFIKEKEKKNRYKRTHNIIFSNKNYFVYLVNPWLEISYFYFFGLKHKV